MNLVGREATDAQTAFQMGDVRHTSREYTGR